MPSREEFALTLEFALELQEAMKRQGWTLADVERLCKGNILTDILVYVRHGVLPNTEDLSQATAVSIADALRQHFGIAEREKLPMLGVRIANALEKDGVRTLGDLANKSEAEIRKTLGLGDRTLPIVFGMLKRLGLYPGMKLGES